MISMLGEKEKAGFDRIKPTLPKKNPEELYGIFAVRWKDHTIWLI